MKLNKLSIAVAVLGLCFVGKTAVAQNSPSSNPTTADPAQQTTQDPVATPNQQQQQQSSTGAATPTAPQTKVFSGKIVKTGDQLILSDADGKTTYMLDDQAKAKDFVNKDVKVTGSLDASSNTIRVSAIDPS